jgi:penicillin amidase
MDTSLRNLGRVALLGLALALASCDDDTTPDGGVVDGSAPDGSLPEGTIALPGLDGPVEVRIDDRGMPHIYGTTTHDLYVVQGYLMARDRFAQMEFIRRGVLGTLGEVLATIEPSVVEDDIAVRQFGFGRVGRAIYASLDEGDPTRRAAEDFVEGINLWIARVLQGPGYAPPRGLELLNIVRVSPNFGPWEPSDVFSLARFQAWNLSYESGGDIGRSRALAGVHEAFVSPESPDARTEARVGAFADLFSTVQARRVSTIDGFPGVEEGDRMALGGGGGALPADAPVLESLEGAARFFDRIDALPWMRRDEHNGSNNWLVSGDLTASGHPILSNDPHLSLTAPGVWWYVHMNTAEMGGERDIDVEGVAFAGLPGVVIGFNQDLAWGVTTTSYDVSDVYQEDCALERRSVPWEEIPIWVPTSVRFQEADVAVTTLDEPIVVAGQAEPLAYQIFDVPHHGPIILSSVVVDDDTIEGNTARGTALSVRYTGDEVTNELAAFTQLAEASTIDEARQAQQAFVVGSQNFIFADRSGDIRWATQARVPVRMPAACTWRIDERGVFPLPTDAAPAFVPEMILPGNGMFEWTDMDIPDENLPQALNPTLGYLATANQDAVGVTHDGNPCNGVDPDSAADDFYLGGYFAQGFRQARILERLEFLAARGDITVEDMQALQGETRSSLGETLRDPIVASLNAALAVGGGAPSSDAALVALVGTLTEDDADALRDVVARLEAWSLATPAGIGATGATLSDSVATTLFNAIMGQTIQAAFADEFEAIGQNPGSGSTARLLEWSMDADDVRQAERMFTYRESYLGIEGWNDTVLWDDLRTEAVETRDERVLTATLAALAFLTAELGDDVTEWRWGRLHTVRFDQIVPSTSVATEVVSIPPQNSEAFPSGFPRPGDYGAVDVMNWSLLDPTRFGALPLDSRGQSGPSMRMVVEMTPDGPVPYNVIPGGQSEDPDSPRHADEAELWRTNQAPRLRWTRAEVEANTAETLQFVAE